MCSASWFQRVETEDGEREIGPVTPVTDSVFQINYKETLEEAAARFSDWPEDAIVRGLNVVAGDGVVRLPRRVMARAANASEPPGTGVERTGQLGYLAPLR